MRSSVIDSAVEQVTAGLDALAATDVVALDNRTLRGQLLDLLTIVHRAQAELTRRVDVFDRRGLAEPDGFRTTRSWLIAFGRLAGGVAGRVVKAARVLRALPKLAAAAQSGDVSPEHIQLVVRLTDQVKVERVAEVDAVLADAARMLDASRFQAVCARVQAHVDPDGTDPAKDFGRRAITLAPAQGMMWVRGQLDAEGGATLATALDAVMLPPGGGDDRTAAQRRADALVELARCALRSGKLPEVAGQRPQVGVLLYPQALSPTTLARLAEVHRGSAMGVVGGARRTGGGAADRVRRRHLAGHPRSRCWHATRCRPGIPPGATLDPAGARGPGSGLPLAGLRRATGVV